MGSGNDIRVVHPLALLSDIVDNTRLYKWYAVELDSGAVQGRGGCNSFLTDLWLMDVLVLLAHFEMDSRLKLMDSRIRRRLLLIRDLRDPMPRLQVRPQAKKMHVHGSILEIAIRTSTSNL